MFIEGFNPVFRDAAHPGDALTDGFNLSCGSSRWQTATAILSKKIALAVSPFGNILSRRSVLDNAPIGAESPRPFRPQGRAVPQGRRRDRAADVPQGVEVSLGRAGEQGGRHRGQ